MICNRCHEERGDDFSPGRKICRLCNRAYQAAKRADPEFRAQELARVAELRKRHPERVNASNRKYNAANRDRQRRWARKAALKAHGWTLEEWDAAVLRQNGLCAVPNCGRPVEVADHCHASGYAREALCGGCNKALGLIADSPARAEGLAVYLIRHGRGEMCVAGVPHPDYAKVPG